jgi:hypothetical protein
MTKEAIKPRNIPMDLHRDSSLEVTSVVGQQASVEGDPISQQAVEVESASQQASEAADAGAQQASEAAGAGVQHVDLDSLINLISLVMFFPSIIFDL